MDTNGTAFGSKGCGQGSQPSQGLTAELLNLFSSLGRHVQALGALAGEETREAAGHYLRLAVLLAAAVFFAAFGYILVLLFAAFLIAMVFHVAWIWILLGLATLHLLLAFFCTFLVWGRWRTPVFTATKGEVARDLELLGSRRNP